MDKQLIKKAELLVNELFVSENSGHGMDHILRVVRLAENFAENEKCNKTIVVLSALLHNADDYKLFGDKNQKELTNTNKILTEIGASTHIKEQVLEIVATIGYSKRLKGIKPKTIEGKIVSDADMCDALGAQGILRTQQYILKHNKPFFDKDIFPNENLTAESYKKDCADTGVVHLFEKMLKLKDLMFTQSGKKEALIRHNFVVNFLEELFYEENASNWQQYLNDFLNKI